MALIALRMQRGAVPVARRADCVRAVPSGFLLRERRGELQREERVAHAVRERSAVVRLAHAAREGGERGALGVVGRDAVDRGHEQHAHGPHARLRNEENRQRKLAKPNYLNWLLKN